MNYTRETLAHLDEAQEHADALADNPVFDTRGALGYRAAHIQAVADDIAREVTDYHFILALQEQGEDGYRLADDGTLDTVIQCPVCDGWLRFDGRESATMFLEDDSDPCWLCVPAEEQEDKEA